MKDPQVHPERLIEAADFLLQPLDFPGCKFTDDELEAARIFLKRLGMWRAKKREHPDNGKSG